jgi:hypothetical protein
LPLPITLRDELIDNGHARPHHYLAKSGRITVPFENTFENRKYACNFQIKLWSPCEKNAKERYPKVLVFRHLKVFVLEVKGKNSSRPIHYRFNGEQFPVHRWQFHSSGLDHVGLGASVK